MSSPASTAGAGFKFEDRIVASYLVAILAQAPGRGLPGLYVTSVLTQRAQLGEPLDDVIVGGIREDGTPTKLSLQAKSDLTFTSNDDEWVEVIGQAWATFSASAPIFRAEHNRLGVAIRHVSARADKYYVSVLAWAEHSASAVDFLLRISQEGVSHEDQRTFVATVRDLLAKAANRPIDDDTLWRFLRVFHIIHFDFVAGETSRDVESAQDRLRHWLAPEARLRAPDLWDHLIVVAGEMTTVAGSTTRELLISKLQSNGFPVAPAATSWRDLKAVKLESHRTLAAIKTNLHGLELNRSPVVAAIREECKFGRFVQIDGEPGSGKSACLKQLALEAARLGPVVVLKDVGIHPGGWSAHASQLGIDRDVRALLLELGAAGEPTLFIDGIDKITDPAAQLTVNDVVRAIANDPSLNGWTIVVTVREQNLNYLSTWLDPDAMGKLPIRTVTVPALSKAELGIVAARFPRLRPLLIEAEHVDKILSRPFFLDAILRLAIQDRAETLPASEIELVNLWWKWGGAEAGDPVSQGHRRNVLIDLASRLLTGPRSTISIRDLRPQALEELRSTGVIRDRVLGHSVHFVHDIYEEWALCEWLLGKLPNAAQTLLDAGQPDALVRPLQLVASHSLEMNQTEIEWRTLYEDLRLPSLRPVWQRSVLLACVRSTRSRQILERLSAYLNDREGDGLSKLLNALTTLEVTPNPIFLNEATFPDLTPEQRVAYANQTARPKIMIWVRFLNWYLQGANLPLPFLIPILVPLFRTWQDTFSGSNVRHCQRIGEIASAWLEEFEVAIHPEKNVERRHPYDLNLTSEIEAKLEVAIRDLFLASTADCPALVSAYLSKHSTPKRRRRLREEIMSSGNVIAKVIPKEFVEYIKTVFLKHPKHSDKGMVHDRMFEREMGIDGTNSFRPASPLQPPFLALLNHAQPEGLRLIRDICNHSIEVWRWLRALVGFDERSSTPEPVTISFPWGTQTFWGDYDVYVWFRGSGSSSDASTSALMALEHWALERIKAGDNFDTIFRLIIEGNDAVAVLGVAVSLCLAHPDLSTVSALPLITCPHIWNWDLPRSAHETTASAANQLASWRRSPILLRALRELNQRPHRSASIRDIVHRYVLTDDAQLQERYVAGIEAFTNNLPFDYAEERSDPARAKALHAAMEWNIELAHIKYWHITPLGDGKFEIWNDPPSKNKAERLQFLESFTQMSRHLRLKTWAAKCLDADRLLGDIELTAAWDEARTFDQESLFEVSNDSLEDGHRRDAVAGVAYILARFATSILWQGDLARWAFSTLDRASKYRDSDPLAMRDSALSAHPLPFAAHGFSALIHRGYEREHAQQALLTLAGSPLQSVCAAVATSARYFAEQDPHFYRILFVLFARHCVIAAADISNQRTLSQSAGEIATWKECLATAQAGMQSGEVPSLPDVPMPWIATVINAQDGENETRRYARNPMLFRWDLAEHTLVHFDVAILLADARLLPGFITFIEQMREMTFQEIVPPFAETQHDYNGNTPFQWIYTYFTWLGRISCFLTKAEVDRVVLAPLFARESESGLMAVNHFMRSYLAYALGPPAQPTDDALLVWNDLAQWVIDHPETQRHQTRMGRDLAGCVSALLFCYISDFSPIQCAITTGWKPILRFQNILQRVIENFGAHRDVFHVIVVFFGAGGLDLFPNPGLTWLYEIARKTKHDHEFWKQNGDATVALLGEVIAQKALVMSLENRTTLTLITDILVDSGVRAAGFLQQQLLRERSH